MTPAGMLAIRILWLVMMLMAAISPFVGSAEE
jgi:hypothetical protein